MQAAPTSIEGFEGFWYTNDQQIAELVIPALNFFSMQFVNTGRHEGGKQVYRNVKIGEPAAEMFVPPPGAVVEARKEERGIVYRAPDERVHH